MGCITCCGLCAMMAVISTVLPSLMLGFEIKRLGATTAAILSSLGPVSTIVLAAMFLQEPTTVSDLVGLVLVVAGVTVIAREKERLTSH